VHVEGAVDRKYLQMHERMKSMEAHMDSYLNLSVCASVASLGGKGSGGGESAWHIYHMQWRIR
jgi:hypothetical protein